MGLNPGMSENCNMLSSLHLPTHAHACTHTHTHKIMSMPCFLAPGQIATPIIKWLVVINWIVTALFQKK